MATVDMLGVPPAAYIHAYVSSAYDSQTGQWNNLNCGAEVEKVNITHSTSTNTQNFTIIEAGYYMVDASFRIEDSNEGSIRSIRITVGGTTVASEDYPPLDTGLQVQNFDFVTHLKLAASDVVVCQMYQDKGGTREIEAGSTASYLKLIKVR